jgi:diguanylate cyclase (GGDEF)-like protein
MVCNQGAWRCLGGEANGAPPQLVDDQLGGPRLAQAITLPTAPGGDLILDLGGGSVGGTGGGGDGLAALVLRNAQPQPSIDRRESSVHRYVAEVLRGQFALSLKRVVLFGELQALARIDPLTGTHRRWYAESRLGELVEAGEVLAVAMIDIDFFKRFNDQFGHAGGDQVLEMVGRTLVNTLRSSDLVARFGGEEFLAILPETNPTGAELVAERLRSAIARIANLPAQVTVSIGIAACNQDETVESLVSRADKALYRAKAAGRNRVMVDEGGGLQHLRTTARKTRHGTTSLVRRAGGTTAITAAMTTPPLPPPPDGI